ncbi:PAS domain S-box-containing protein [Deinococcus yavapaiensis KR-236]|uniref:histidine kinase n=1 Tax=Deinococcus yavapaiensis KR-236 TaxID=694435 RepID=A0A318SEK9_9DEIO|nr:PAS domain S-box-containing protein [Deinococcus yavapaiensis KR-236]
MRVGIGTLAARVLLTVAILMLALGTIVAYTVTRGFLSARDRAAERANVGMEHEISRRLLQQAESEAQASETRLLAVGETARLAANVWANLPLDASRAPTLRRAASGAWYDARPNRAADVWLPRGVTLDASTRRDVLETANLDALFPALLSEHSDGVALYFTNAQSMTRYYPPLGLHRVLPPDLDIAHQAPFMNVRPERDPARLLVWSPPYLDDAGHGLLVTASAPLYKDGVFRGMIAVDVSLNRLTTRLRGLNPTRGGSAMLLDRKGRVLAAPEGALTLLLGRTPPKAPRELLRLSLVNDAESALRDLKDTFARGGLGARVIDAHGSSLVVTFAPLPTLGWTLVLVSPLEEVTATRRDVATAIELDADRTLTLTGAFVLGFFVVGLTVTALLAHVGLLRPIARLTRAARAVTAGNLDVRVPARRRDELGTLGDAFNTMLERLQARGRELRRSQERYELAVRGSNDGLWEWNLGADDVYFSPRWKAILGYEDHELANTLSSWRDQLHPDERDHVTRSVDAHLASGGDLLEFEHRLRHKDGSWRWVLSRGATSRDEAGRALRFAGSHTDITERVEAYRLLERRVAERTRELEAVLAVMKDLTFGANLRETLDNLARGVVEVTGAVAAAVLLDDQGDSKYGGTFGLPPGFEAADAELARRMKGRGMMQQTLHDGATVVWRGTRASALATPEYAPLHPFMRDAAWDTVVSVPLVYGGRLLGTLAAYYPQDRDVNEADMHLVEGIAGQAAVAVENARLFADAGDRAALQERHKLARELHDSVSQALYGIALGGRTTLRLLERSPEKAPDSVKYMLSLAEAALAEMRALIFELRPESLEQEGLSMALAKLASALQARHGLEVSLDLGDEPDLGIDAKVALLRIAQEATHNTVKHAGASRVELRLWQEGSVVVLEVHDDGMGFDPGVARQGSLGQKTMRERATAVGGTCSVTSSLGRGTLVRVEVGPRVLV